MPITDSGHADHPFPGLGETGVMPSELDRAG
jgi:hypothetical protein